MRRKSFIWSFALLGAFSLSACSALPPATTPSNPVTSVATAPDTTVTTTTTTPAVVTPIQRSCADDTGNWSSRDNATPVRMVRGQINDIRVGQHDCFDRVVIEVNTTDVVGFQVRYATYVSHVGSGREVPVAGGAVLRVDINAPATVHNNVISYSWRGNWPALKQVASGGSLEGMTVFALGVDHKVPFEVYHLKGTTPNTMRVVIDIAHR